MKQIWAPWRMDYILQDKPDKCIFCQSLSAPHNKKKLILYNGRYSLVMLNRYPYTNCHLLVAPRKHIASPEELTKKESLDLFLTLNYSIRQLKKALHPDGFNIGMNLGRIAGAGVEDHLHFHIVPRWRGDTNFMPVLAEAVVIPQHLKRSFSYLLPFFKNFKT